MSTMLAEGCMSLLIAVLQLDIVYTSDKEVNHRILANWA